VSKHFGEYPKGFPAWISLDSKHERAGEDVLVEDVACLNYRTMHIVKPKGGGEAFPIKYEHLLFDIAERAGISIWSMREKKTWGDGWQKARVKRNHRHRCAICFKGGGLQLHHTTYALSVFTYAREPDNVFMPLCEECHFGLHRNKWGFIGDPEQASALSILEAGIESDFRREDDEGINGSRRNQELGKEVG
jgi:hypothetical protein